MYGKQGWKSRWTQGGGLTVSSVFSFGPARGMVVSRRARSPLAHSRISAHFRVRARVLCQAMEDNGNIYMRSLANDLEESHPSSSMSTSSKKDKGDDKGFNSSLGMRWLTDRCPGNRDSEGKEDLYQVLACFKFWGWFTPDYDRLLRITNSNFNTHQDVSRGHRPPTVQIFKVHGGLLCRTELHVRVCSVHIFPDHILEDMRSWSWVSRSTCSAPPLCSVCGAGRESFVVP